MNRRWMMGLLALLLCAHFLQAAVLCEGGVSRIGILAKRGSEVAIKRWVPTAHYLQEKIPECRFEIVAIDFDATYGAVNDKSVDFLLVNPAIYIDLEMQFGVSRIATMENRIETKAGDFHTTLFGGVIFTRSDNPLLYTLEQLHHQRFAAVDKTSMGGWLIARWELDQHKIDPFRDFQSLQFLGTHDAVVFAVLSGEVDAGTVRTDTLERMAQEGKIDLAALRVISPKESESFPLLLSSRLYPEWPFAKLRHTDNTLAHQVAIALMQMPGDSEAAQAAQVFGWTIPQDYQPVHQLMRALQDGPYAHLRIITYTQVFEQYWYWFVMVVTLLLMAWVFVIALYRTKKSVAIQSRKIMDLNQTLEQRVQERTRELQSKERYLSSILNTNRNMILVGNGRRVVDANRAFLDFMGYSSVAAFLKEHSCISEFFIPNNEEGFLQGSEMEGRNWLDFLIHNAHMSYKAEIKCHGKSHIFVVKANDMQEEDEEKLVVLNDISELQETAMELRLSHTVLNNMQEGVLITDKENHILYINPFFTSITHFLEEDVMGKNPRILKSGEHGSDFYFNLWKSIREDGFWQGEVINRRKNGERYVEWLTIYTIKDKEGHVEYHVATFSDITVRKQMETTLREEKERYKIQATHDYLTQIYNRVRFSELFDYEYRRSRRYGTRLCVIILDIDLFKMVNDTYGHLAGDEILVEMTTLVKRSIRSLDIFARWGGEEFILLSANMTLEEAVTLAEKLRKVIAEHPFPYVKQLTCSFGTSELQKDESADALLKRADDALYKAKENGRNRVEAL